MREIIGLWEGLQKWLFTRKRAGGEASKPPVSAEVQAEPVESHQQPTMQIGRLTIPHYVHFPDHIPNPPHRGSKSMIPGEAIPVFSTTERVSRYPKGDKDAELRWLDEHPLKDQIPPNPEDLQKDLLKDSGSQ